VKALLEYFLDFTNIYTVYSLYAGVILGISLKFLIEWSLKDTNIELITNKIEFTLTINDLQIQKKSRIIPNQLLIWIVKRIRNKCGTGDDNEADMIFLPN
jgi:hypothetical protein